MFDGVAQRYDLANDVLALGQTRIWRRAVVQAVKPVRGEMILDLLTVRVCPVEDTELVVAWPGDTATTKIHIRTEVNLAKF